MTDTGFKIIPFEAVHVPTGVRLRRPNSTQPGSLPDPYLLSLSPLAASPCELYIEKKSSLARAKQMRMAFDDWSEEETFRRDHGNQSMLERIVCAKHEDPAQWDSVVLGIVTTLFFVLDDPAGFRAGKPAYPDTLDLNASELNPALRCTVTNPYAKGAP